MPPAASRPSVASILVSDSSVPSAAESQGSPPSVSTAVIPPTPTRRSQTDPVNQTSRSSPQLPTPSNAPHHEHNPRPRVDSTPVRLSEGPQPSARPPPNPLFIPSVGSANTLTPDAAVGGDSHKLSRDSRITLPDETSRYLNYTHPIESPIASPGLNNTNTLPNPQREGSTPPSPLRGGGRASQEDEVSVSGPSIVAASVSSSSEFLDLESTDDGEYTGRSSQEPAGPQQPQHHPAPVSLPQQQQNPAFGKPGGVPGSAPPRPPRRRRSSDAVEPSQDSNVEPVPSLERVSSDTTARSVGGAGSIASSTTFISSQAHSNHATQAMAPLSQQDQQLQRQQQQQQQHSRHPNSLQQQQQGNPPSFPYGSTSDLRIEYKSAKLMNDDLAHTAIHVDGSTIRSNDRGKEVLSFLISVNVKGKEPWKVEKLYSDVLALDGRVRVGVGKTQGKKIAPLPDNKLFKDNAPAKVDQRKIALEAYLQSLVAANLKTRDDVCMFFSTGIIRPEREPVHQVGHKEGYLTKRSKNFGGCVFCCSG